MSFEDGWAAINLEMPKRVPRTEYSVEMHYDLVKAITGIDVTLDSTDQVKADARKTLMQAWNYDFIWNVWTYRHMFGDLHTDMGHAEYAVAGSDRRDPKTSPFSTTEEVLNFDPWETFGQYDQAVLTQEFEDHYKASCEYYPDAVNMTGVYVTMISGLLELFGWDMLLLACGTDPVRFGELANRYSSWIQQSFDALAAADVPAVMIHDDMVWTSGAIFRPDWYRQYVFPNIKRQIHPLVESGKKIMFTSDGNYTEFIDDIADWGVNGFVLEPSVDMEYIAKKYGKTHAFIGNADTRVLLDGTKQQIRAEVERCMAIGKNCPGFFMAVGNHIPPNTPVENALYYNEVYEELSKR
ncbi:MAG: hypothetical protein JW936_10710 [Sedimentisphaerales bacterium]|nr:hypothetical protein [Sedimentisphaerales bacterium]